MILYEDHNPYEIPEELKLCLLEEPYVYDIFEAYTDGEKKTITEWIYSAKSEQTKAERIAKIINDIVDKNPRY
ncbi:YdeI/OmpD-associated family protein [Elizabethkingia miricola]|uniref:YdeI/OmpD-associated family protein n=1 Tax=Elizabethkingia miricola TaxID=172045 RepID=UPI003892BB4B